MKLFRATLSAGITNNTSKNLVIDSLNAAGNGLSLVVNAPTGEQHAYIFPGLEAKGVQGSTFFQVAQLTKIIVKPGETLVQSGTGSAAEVTGHYE